MKRLFVLSFAAMLMISAAACDDDDAQNLRENVEDATGSAGARAAAEAMRGALEAQDLDGGKSLRDVAVLRENAEDVPGDPAVEGIADADGDGKDDDGRVELHVGEQAACVIVSAENDVSVENGECAT
jgi:hypothetical protein